MRDVEAIRKATARALAVAQQVDELARQWADLFDPDMDVGDPRYAFQRVLQAIGDKAIDACGGDRCDGDWAIADLRSEVEAIIGAPATAGDTDLFDPAVVRALCTAPDVSTARQRAIDRGYLEEWVEFDESLAATSVVACLEDLLGAVLRMLADQHADGDDVVLERTSLLLAGDENPPEIAARRDGSTTVITVDRGLNPLVALAHVLRAIDRNVVDGMVRSYWSASTPEGLSFTRR